MDSLKDKAEELDLLRKAKKASYKKKWVAKNPNFYKEQYQKRKEYIRNWQKNNPDKMKKPSKEYSREASKKSRAKAVKNDPEYYKKENAKRKVSPKEYYIKNKKEISKKMEIWLSNNPDYHKKYSQRMRDSIHNCYVIETIRSRGENPDNYTEEMKEIVRFQIKIKRELKI